MASQEDSDSNKNGSVHSQSDESSHDKKNKKGFLGGIFSGQKKNQPSSKEETEELHEFDNIGECPVLGQK